MEVSIRIAGMQDLAALTHLGAVTFRQAYGAQNTAADLDFYIGHYLNQQMTLLDLQDPGTVFYMAHHQQEPAGYVKLKTMSHDLLGCKGNILELKRIYVLNTYYGTGIARYLLEQAEVYALQNKLGAVNLAVWKENHRAIAFYRKHGFETVGETTFDWGTGKVDSDWVMKKSVVYH